MGKLSSLKRSADNWEGVAYGKREPLYNVYEKRDPVNDYNAQQLSDYMTFLSQQ